MEAGGGSGRLRQVSQPTTRDDAESQQDKPLDPMVEEGSVQPAPLLGAALATLALIVGPLALSIRRTGIGGNHDPGPGAFPILLASLLLLGGLWEIARWLWKLSRAPARSAAARDALPGKPLAGDSVAGGEVLLAGGDQSPGWLPAGMLNVALMTGGLILYVASLPVIGFMLATWLGVVAMLRALGTRWRWAMLAALVLVASVYGLFTLLFRVQLPTGFWDSFY